MPQSLAKILVHAVFSTKNRADLIPVEIENDLFPYIHGITANHESKLITANGTSNHVHLLISLGRTIDISGLIGEIKRSTSLWIKTKDDRFENFYWQEGFGAFSIGQSEVPILSKYIANQKLHHAKYGFKDEFRGLLKRYEVDYDERYVWD
jgi:REP element-mobilizing transposase RayT